ncbi:MAG: NUDIX domain-containing protein [Candidatus Saccharimonadales bacterium]
MNVAILWLINEKGEILLSQRAATMTSNAGVWGPSVSGKIDEGETAQAAAVREANEELGIIEPELATIQHLHDASHVTSSGELREFSVFYAEVSSGITDALALEPTEVAAVKWVTFAGLQGACTQQPETIIVSSDKELWKQVFDNLQAVLP